MHLNTTNRYLSYFLNKKGGLSPYKKFLRQACLGMYVHDLYYTKMTGKAPFALYIHVMVPEDRYLRMALKDMAKNPFIIDHYFSYSTNPHSFGRYVFVYQPPGLKQKEAIFKKGLYNQLYTPQEIKSLKILKEVGGNKTHIYRALTFDPRNITEEDLEVERVYLSRRFGDIKVSLANTIGQLDVPPIARDEILNYINFPDLQNSIEWPKENRKEAEVQNVR